MMLQHWEFPDQIALVPRHYLDHTRHTEAPDYISIVAVAANEAARINSTPTSVPSDQISGYGHLEIDPNDPDFQTSINEQAQEAASSS